MHYTTSVEIDDNTMGYRVYLPCKRFDAHFSFDNEKMVVDAEVFAFKDRKVKADRIDKDRIRKTIGKDNVHVEINDWILPGDGILFIMGKNSS